MMSGMFLTVVDVLLAVGFTLRLSRLAITDDISSWWLRWPAVQWAARHDRQLAPIPPPGQDWEHTEGIWIPRWRSKLVDGLTCPWCVGFWLACLVLLSLYIAGGPGDAWALWRWVAGAFTLNWVTAHIGGPLGDYGYAEEDED